MTRRKHLARRQPNGDIARGRPPPDLMSPTEVRRMVDAARHGLRDPVWASQVGILRAMGLITDSQFAAARRWTELGEEYAAAVGAPRAPRSARLEPTGGEAPDPDSATGVRQARRERKTVEAYLTATKLLAALGEAPGAALVDVVDRDSYPTSPFQLSALKGALSALAALWGRK